MTRSERRIAREKKTIRAMMKIYCHSLHKTKDNLCAECSALLDYANMRLERCPFVSHKPTCANCGIHCYKPAMRDKVKDVMRYAGPRMIHRHPLLAVLHFADGFRRQKKSSKS
jgi:hypothetical protein